MAHICDFSVILGANAGYSFWVHVFDDPGVEILSESGGRMCYNHKSCVFFFVWFHFFPLIHKVGVLRDGSGLHFE